MAGNSESAAPQGIVCSIHYACLFPLLPGYMRPLYRSKGRSGRCCCLFARPLPLWHGAWCPFRSVPHSAEFAPQSLRSPPLSVVLDAIDRVSALQFCSLPNSPSNSTASTLCFCVFLILSTLRLLIRQCSCRHGFWVFSPCFTPPPLSLSFFYVVPPSSFACCMLPYNIFMHRPFTASLLVSSSEFPTSRLEMEKVAEIFDHDGDGFIEYRDFVAALRPDSEMAKTMTDAERIHDEVKRQAAHCTCNQKYKINKIGDGKYKVGDDQPSVLRSHFNPLLGCRISIQSPSKFVCHSLND